MLMNSAKSTFCSTRMLARLLAEVVRYSSHLRPGLSGSAIRESTLVREPARMWTTACLRIHEVESSRIVVSEEGVNSHLLRRQYLVDSAISSPFRCCDPIHCPESCVNCTLLAKSGVIPLVTNR